jgi:hypothetical protein
VANRGANANGAQPDRAGVGRSGGAYNDRLGAAFLDDQLADVALWQPAGRFRSARSAKPHDPKPAALAAPRTYPLLPARAPPSRRASTSSCASGCSAWAK